MHFFLSRRIDKNHDGTIDYDEFTQGIRYGRLGFHKTKQRRRVQANPDEPLGDSRIEKDLPFGVMADAPKNLEKFDKEMDRKYGSIAASFKKYDVDNSGDIDLVEFKKALDAAMPKAHLTKSEMEELFHDADRDGGGAIDYTEFLASFGQGKRCIPEFMKPKRMRRSQNG